MLSSRLANELKKGRFDQLGVTDILYSLALVHSWCFPWLILANWLNHQVLHKKWKLHHVKSNCLPLDS